MLIHDLPDDILESIFILLIRRKRLTDTKSLSLTSKHLNGIYNSVINNQCNNDADIYRWLYPHKNSPIKTQVIQASEEGKLNVLELFLEDYGRDILIHMQNNIINECVIHGHLSILKWFHENIYELTHYFIDIATGYDHLDVVKYLYEIGCRHSTFAMDNASEHGYIDTVKFLHEKGMFCTEQAMDEAAKNGHLHVIKWLYENISNIPVKYALNLAASEGHFEVVKWLYENISNIWYSKAAINNAITNGHLEIAKYLLENDCGSYYEYSFISAAGNGHLHILKWYHEDLKHNKIDGNCLNIAAKNNHLDIIKYICENIRLVGNNSAINYAAFGGHLRIIQWLCENRINSDYNEALNKASENGHFETAKWLYKNKMAIIMENTMDGAASNGHFEILKWLYSIGAPCSENVPNRAVANGHLNIVKWLNENGLIKEKIILTMCRGYLHIIKYLYENNLLEYVYIGNNMTNMVHRGHVEGVIWLHEILHINLGAFPLLLDSYNDKKHLDIIRYILSEITVENDMIYSALVHEAKYGHLGCFIELYNYLSDPSEIPSFYREKIQRKLDKGHHIDIMIWLQRRL